jgi:hypothetical protein
MCMINVDMMREYRNKRILRLYPLFMKVTQLQPAGPRARQLYFPNFGIYVNWKIVLISFISGQHTAAAAAAL